MIEKFKELLQRAKNLSYKDTTELDYIKQKAEMYVDQTFPTKPTYKTDVRYIEFESKMHWSNQGNDRLLRKWEQGKQELVNFLDTRIEELELQNAKENAKKPEVKVVEKIVKVKDEQEVHKLNAELRKVKSRKSLWNRINYLALFSIVATLIGGAFVLGRYFAENRFDKEKIELINDNQRLKTIVDSCLHKGASEITQGDSNHIKRP